MERGGALCSRSRYRPQQAHHRGLGSLRGFREAGWQLPAKTLPSLMNGCCSRLLTGPFVFREAACLSPVNPCRPGSEQVAFCAPGSAPGQERSGKGKIRALSARVGSFHLLAGAGRDFRPRGCPNFKCCALSGVPEALALLRHAGESQGLHNFKIHT